MDNLPMSQNKISVKNSNKKKQNIEMVDNSNPPVVSTSNSEVNLKPDFKKASKQSSVGQEFDQRFRTSYYTELIDFSFEDPDKKTNQTVTKGKSKVPNKVAKSATATEHGNSKDGDTKMVPLRASRVEIPDQKNSGKMKKKRKWITQFSQTYGSNETEVTVKKIKTSSGGNDDIAGGSTKPSTSTCPKGRFVFQEHDLRDLLSFDKERFNRPSRRERYLHPCPMYPSDDSNDSDFDVGLANFFPIDRKTDIPYSKDDPSVSDLLNEILDQNEGLKNMFYQDFMREKNRKKRSGQ